ncbi:hypothetical protein BDY19DRAFT_909076 [Irpex rosettiformis]|uniref:Uncharacterized protein n=1 Tax=Irpex rosettiformis TaxID=378272 RepID=A0ACB8TTU0_9APHY|nr:hypothetical protein BDY19DRAFT_909076 [Irpex rosettiformis]
MASLVMTQTLSSSSSSSPDPELFTPPPSHATLQQVPDVFVIPPEEEHHENPPFCYFDAAMESKRSLSVMPDIDALDAALGMCQQTDNRAPVFHRSMNESQDTVVMPRRSSGRDEVPVVPKSPSKRRILDDDVVEVVKVSRKNGVSNTPVGVKKESMKKSMSFRARATLAFLSLKSVGKGSRKAVPEGWGAPEGVGSQQGAVSATEHGAIPQQQSLKITRKPSNLKQLFAPTTVKTSTPDVPTSPTSPTSSDSWSAISRPSIAAEDANVQFPSTGERDARPSFSGKHSFVRRISARNIFAPATPTRPNIPSPLKEDVTPLPSRREFVVSSHTASSIDIPRVDMEDVFSGVASNGRPHSFHASTSLASSTIPALGELPSTSSSTDQQNTDSSFELHLDSLHFDSLQFDPEEFLLQLNDN